ncbi:FMO-4 protein [Aphelenchoides avenae]|nr:FMO-4 protein [Aphelenchus avenae]
MKSTVVNTSKEMMAYSDFPPNESLPNFMHHSLVLQYIKDYAEAYDLKKHIVLETEVAKVRRDPDASGWIVETRRVNGGFGLLKQTKVERFDKVMLCTGHHSEPYQPPEILAGLRSFKGEILHAKKYRDHVGFEDKNVFIVGIGNSALDIAVELARISKSVTISTRRGTWVFNRVSQGGMPYDVVLMSRLYHWLYRVLPWTVINDFMEHRLQQRMDHDLYGLRPPHRFFQQHPTVNDSLANLMASGLITVTEDVEFFQSDSVVVKGGRRFPADVIILCTGYDFRFPYLEPEDIIPVNGHQVDLYKFVFPPNKTDLAVIGLIQPIGSLAPISEMQSRWAARVFIGRTELPTPLDMTKDIAEKRRQIERRYYRSPKHTLQVDYVPYMDELAEQIGCKPSIPKVLLEDYRFALRLFVGGNVPYVYRLVGPHSWSGARDAIWDVPKRVKLPLKNRQCRTRRHKKRGTLDEYFRYGSRKWLAGWTCLIFVGGLWTFCSGPAAIPVYSYFSYVLLFFFVFSFMLLWFDLQYDMSTIF